MTRLARHDEIVERMAQELYANMAGGTSDPTLTDHLAAICSAQATAALDSLLTAVRDLHVGIVGKGMDELQRFYPALIIQLEDKP